MTTRKHAALDQSEPMGSLLGDRVFSRFQGLIHAEAGIWLSSAKRALLVGRLARRTRELGLSFAEYCARVETDAVERDRMLDHITTNETHFFREPRHFDFLAGELFPRWRREGDAGRRPRRVRAWSTACSTGEEPYSLGMTLLHAFPPGSGWDLEILATDLSNRVLALARDAVWPIDKATEIPPSNLKAFMLRGVGAREGTMKACPELRSLVRFERLNLAAPSMPGVGTFDLVFCRNVLIYFDPPTKERVVRRLLGNLAPHGYMFLGHAESLSGMGLAIRNVSPTVYARTEPRPSEVEGCQ